MIAMARRSPRLAAASATPSSSAEAASVVASAAPVSASRGRKRAAAATATPPAATPVAAPPAAKAPRVAASRAGKLTKPAVAATAMTVAAYDHNTALRTLLANDPLLAPLMAKATIPASFRKSTWGIERAVDGHFQALCRTIIYQQLAGNAAKAIFTRFLALFPPPPTWRGPADDYFPEPARLLQASLEQLRAIGLSERKASYLQDLAAKVVDGTLELHRFHQLPDEVIAQQLLAVRGIGQWTVDMHLMFQLDRKDVLPVGDLGVRKGVMRHFGLRALPTPDEMRDLTERWQPYRSLGSWLMWAAADTNDGNV